MIPTALPLTDEAGQVSHLAGIAPFVRVGMDCVHYSISEPALFEAQDEQIADIRRVESGEQAMGGYPTVYDGLRGMRFITKVVERSQQGAVWVDF